MKLFGVILKLIQTLGLTSSDEFQVLHNDVKQWELEKATENSSDTIGKMYHKLHQGVFARLLFPFLYFFALKEVKNIMSDETETDFLD